MASSVTAAASTAQAMYFTVTICRRVTGSVSQYIIHPSFSSALSSDAGSDASKNTGYSSHITPEALRVPLAMLSAKKMTTIRIYDFPYCHRLRASL